MKDDKLYLIHISECIARIESYIADSNQDAFMASTLVQDAVLRNLQTLAESTQRLSEKGPGSGLNGLLPKSLFASSSKKFFLIFYHLQTYLLTVDLTPYLTILI